MSITELILVTVKKAFIIVTPWKLREYESDKGKTYAQGWNDCIKEIKKNRKGWIENFKNITK